LFFHGGSRRQMLLGFHYMGYYSNDYSMNQYYAQQGYIVLAVNYRSGIGYGMEFREALHYGANGGSEYNDVYAAGLYMKSRNDVDANRIGLWGGSYGGYLTAMGLSRNSDIFHCGVDIHGVHDWNEELKNGVIDYDPATRASFASTAIASSPVYFVDGWKSPVLFIHGDDDRNVPFDQTVMIIEKLRKRKVYFEQLIIPDEIHDFLLHRTWLTGYHEAADFFNRMMNKGSKDSFTVIHDVVNVTVTEPEPPFPPKNFEKMSDDQIKKWLIKNDHRKLQKKDIKINRTPTEIIYVIKVKDGEESFRYPINK
jgi:dipeptidyl aminopeptidase/acylaminoacyl peptidase